jgi:hypothetical protein
MAEAQHDVDARWRLYEQLAGVDRDAPDLPESDVDGKGAGADHEEGEA